MNLWRLLTGASHRSASRIGQQIDNGATSLAFSPLSPAPAWYTTGGTTSWTVHDPAGTLIELRVGTSPGTATAYFPFTDNHGSVRAMVTSGRAIAATYTYSGYGTTLTDK